MKCCKVIRDNLRFCCAQVREKFKDDLLIGTEHYAKNNTRMCNSTKIMSGNDTRGKSADCFK